MEDDPAEINAARALSHRKMTRLVRFNAAVTLGLVFLGSWLTPLVTDEQPWRALLATAFVVVGAAPMAALLVRNGRVMIRWIDGLTAAREQRTAIEARRRDFDAQVNDALDMADSEHDALRVVERAFAAVIPDQRVELLLADNSHAHLERKAVTSPDSAVAGCAVAAPFDCPAARRARVHRFTDAGALNACPKLSGRMSAGDTAVCLPVSVMGRAAGVIHTIGRTDIAPGSIVISQLGSVAAQVGGRMAMLRVLAETQMQASTDTLTGLLNRRAFENAWQQVQPTGAASVLAMADLDHFKVLNDTYGHDTGDRALRVFADVLRSALRQDDLVCRRGGEEFTIFFPDCDAASAVAGLHRIQQRLQATLASGGLPAFTASFGAVETVPDEELDSLLGRADAALFAAKRAGRNRIAFRDVAGREELFPAGQVGQVGQVVPSYPTESAANAPVRLAAG